jgi:hypothetical protein
MEYLADLILAGGPTLAMRQVGELDRGAAHRTLREGAGRRLYEAAAISTVAARLAFSWAKTAAIQALGSHAQPDAPGSDLLRSTGRLPAPRRAASSRMKFRRR